MSRGEREERMLTMSALFKGLPYRDSRCSTMYGWENSAEAGPGEGRYIKHGI